MRIAIFGQAAFGKDVLIGVAEAGHEIVGVYAPPAKGRPDPLAEESEARAIATFRYARFRKQGVAIPEIVDEYRALDAELNLLAYVTVILPDEIIQAPVHQSLCFHPSLLPRFRGGSAIPWQIIEGEKESGVTVFQPDAGVDTGPVLVQHGGVTIEASDNAASLYYDKLYPLGVRAMVEGVEAIANGSAVFRVQDESQASHQGLVNDAVARIDWSRPADALVRLIRGCDPAPGAHAQLEGTPVRLFGASLLPPAAEAEPGTVLAADGDALILAARGGRVRVAKLRVGDDKKQPAAESGVKPQQVFRESPEPL